jgi:hypothetical protein
VAAGRERGSWQWRFYNSVLIAEQFFQLVAGRAFTRIGFVFGDECSPGEIEILAKISRRFLHDRVGPPVAALVRGAGIVTGAIEAHSQIGVAPVARIPSSGQPGQRPRPAALVAMSGCIHVLHCIHFRPDYQHEIGVQGSNVTVQRHSTQIGKTGPSEMQLNYFPICSFTAGRSRLRM